MEEKKVADDYLPSYVVNRDEDYSMGDEGDDTATKGESRKGRSTRASKRLKKIKPTFDRENHETQNIEFVEKGKS